jgi:hypothetical protein
MKDERPPLSLTLIAMALMLAIAILGAIFMDYTGWGPHGCLRPL